MAALYNFVKTNNSHDESWNNKIIDAVNMLRIFPFSQKRRPINRQL